jgi:hypothetical protein
MVAAEVQHAVSHAAADGVLTGKAGDNPEEAVRSRSSVPITSTRKELRAIAHGSAFHVAVMACLYGVAVIARLAAAEPSWLMHEPPRLSAQARTSSAASETATAGGPASPEELAKKLSNPISSLISVPFQSNFDFNTGQDNDNFKYTLNI